MHLTWQQCQAVVARCLLKFFLDGTLKAYGVIMEETVNSFQSQHYLIGCAFSLQTGMGNVIVPLASIFDQRVHPRIVAFIGGFLAGLGFIGRAFLHSNKLWQLFACLSISGVGFGLVDVTTVISMKEAFEPRYFTTAYSVAQLPSYIGIAVMPPLLEYLQRDYGEHIGMAVFGVLSWTLMLSGLFTPGKTGSEDQMEIMELELLQIEQRGTDSKQGVHKCSQDSKYEGLLNEMSNTGDCNEQSKLIKHDDAMATEGGVLNRIKRRQYGKRGKSDEMIAARTGLKAWIFIAKNHREFLLLTIVSMLLGHNFSSWSIFLVPYGEYLGLDSKTAVWLSTLGGIAGLVGRMCSVALFFVNRMNLSIAFLMPVLCVMSAYVISLFYSSFPVLAVVSFVSGFGLSIQGCVLNSWLPSCVCEYNFKTALYGFYVVSGIMTLAGGITTGGIIDISGSYRISFASLAIVNFIQLTAVFVWLLCASVPSPEKSALSRKDGNTSCCAGK